jgi:AcrR family transcriptional regulator
MSAGHEDPRVTRTREKVLEVVRDIMVAEGPLAVSYSAVAKAAGVGRQTLYNHWATPEEMIRDAAVEGYTGGYPAEVSSAEDAVRQWLQSLAGALADPRRVAALSSLIAVALQGPDAESALRAMVVGRCAAFNELLSTIGLSCSADTYVRMVGPLQFRVLLAREPITDDLIESIAVSIAPELTPR